MAAGPSGTITRQSTNWISPYGNTQSTGVPWQLNAYTGTWTSTGTPSTTSGVNSASPYAVSDGIDGAIMAYIIENNVGTATLNIEGSYDGKLWFAVGYYTVVAASTSQATLTRSVSSLAVVQNTAYVLQLLDAYPLVRIRPSASTGSISAGFYLVPA
jgi:hypothetical protein